MTTIAQRLTTIPSIDRRTAIALGAGFLAAILVLGMTASPDLTPVLVADGALPAGTPLGTLEISYRDVDNTEGLIVGSDIGELATWTLVAPLAAGEPLLTSLIRPPQQLSAPQQMALTVPATQAVLGLLQAGDTVDILVTRGSSATSDVTTVVLASDVFVISAQLAESNAFGDQVRVLLAVTDQLAIDLANAVHGGEIDLVKVSR